ncbi:tetratricopeptide repeat protein [Pseudocolwellia sp. HL-MZ19]|uniref:tetratricopeptide repeat protein n=1 Tax=Pseudocolwellia sp. HL-MZ19 TaxID=3400846 RepID=UPI003CEA0DE4
MKTETYTKTDSKIKPLGLSYFAAPARVISILVVLFVLYTAFIEYFDYKHEADNSLAIISEPKINDIYFMDFRVIKEDLRPHEKYRIAKVADITGDIITLVYGSFYYQRKHATLNAISYGQLTFKDYFEGKRYDFPHNKVKNLFESGAIYLANRPVQNKLYGNLVVPREEHYRSNRLTYGKQENIKGEAFFNDSFNEMGLEKAFGFFQQSAELGFVKGQINLAQMYIDGEFVNKDFNKALHWLKQASLQSSKSAILKYGIICKQVEACNAGDFYQELNESGVNIKVRKLDFELSNAN